MKTGKGCKGILRQGMIVVSLTLLFFTIITVLGFGIEKIQAEKVFSEYSKNSYVIISNDLTKLLVVKRESTDASYWDIEGKENPVLIREVKGRRARAYSPDLRCYAEIKGNILYINRMEDNFLVNKIKLPALFASGKWRNQIEISNDNSKIAVFMKYDGFKQEYMNKNYFYLYDINSGEKIDEIKVFGDSDSITNDPHMLHSFSFDDRYITIQYSKNSALHANIYSVEKGRYVFNDKIDYGGNDGLKRYYFLKEKDLLWIKNIDKKHIEIVDLNKDIYGEIIKSFNYYQIDDSPNMVTDFLGSSYDGTTFNELIVKGDQLIKYKTHQIDDEVIRRVAYNKEKEEWVLLGQNKVHRILSKASNARDSIEQYEEGMELLEIGFAEGVDKVKRTLDKGMITGLAQNSGRFLNTDYDLSLKERAELVLAEYNCLMAGDMIDNYDLLYAHRKLFEYGLLAARAGYPQFTLQAAEQIRGLELIYPYDLKWDKVNKHIILLEAIGIAVRDGSEAGFKHMLDNDGILNDDDNQNYILNTYLNDYPEYFAPLLADKKKMSYFTEIAENELPSVQIWEQEKVDFVDLKGNVISGVEGHAGDSPADGTAGKNNSGESNDLNSGDDKSSDSAGTVLD